MQSFRDLGRHFDLVPAALSRQLSAVDIARGRQEAFARQHPAALESLQQQALIQSVEASNAIENITAPQRRIEQLVAGTTQPRNRPEAEIAGYRAVLDAIHSSAVHIPFTPNIVRQLHRDLYQFAPQPGGDWKSSDNLVTERRSDGSVAVRFTPVSAFGTPAAMDELHERFDRAWQADEHHRLLIAGAYSLDFLVIHPFRDGNGRMSRLLALLLLYKGGYEVGRFVSIEKLIEQSKETYYEALAASTAGWHDGAHDLQPWLSYFLGVLSAAYGALEPRAEALTAGRGAKAELVRSFVRSHVSDNFTFADVKRASPGVSDDYIRQVLRELRDRHVIEATGAGRGASWRRLRHDYQVDLEILEHSDLDLRVALAWLVRDEVAIDEAELNAARRRAMLVLAAGGDPHREIDADSVATQRLAGELDTPDRRAELAAALDRLAAEAQGFPAVTAAVEELRSESDLAWRSLALALLADELSEEQELGPE